nr:hypothetical protein CFP56_25654 [Quercus suber]
MKFSKDLSTRWKKLSLSRSEENRVALRIERKNRDFILAGKFFTRRSLNVEAIAKTFRPLWRTKGGFNVIVGGENILLFAFELEVDAERVIQGEPWAFDSHLVVFENFEGYAPIHTLGFKTTAFWVQIHNLPFPLQTVETAFNIGETLGPAVKDDARVVSNFEEQLQALDHAINSSPELSNLKTDKPGVVSTATPIFSHAKSCINVSKEIQGLNKEEVRYDVDSMEAIVAGVVPIFSLAKSCINVSKESQGLNKEEVRYDVDSLEAIQIEEFNVGQNSTLKEKKSTRGRPRKYPQGELLNTENTSPIYSRNSSQTTRTPKKTWKRIVDKKEIYAEKVVASLDISEKRKIAAIDRMEDHSPEGEKRKKLEDAWESGQLIESDWVLHNCLERCKVDLSSWNASEFVHLGRTIRELQTKLEWLEMQPTSKEVVEALRHT